MKQLEESIKHYWNPLTMVLGSIGYVTVAAFPKSAAVLSPLLMLYAYGITIGLLVCVVQFIHGFWQWVLKGNKERVYLIKMKSLGIWFVGISIFIIGLMNGLILTV